MEAFGLWCQAAEHDADHGHADEGGSDAAVPLEVADQTPIGADPSDGALDDPTLRQHDEAVPVAATHDLDFPCASARDGCRHLRPLIAGIADDALDEGEQPACLTQQRFGAIAILHVGWMHYDREQHADGVGQQAALAVCDLIARVVAGRIGRRASCLRRLRSLAVDDRRRRDGLAPSLLAHRDIGTSWTR